MRGHCIAAPIVQFHADYHRPLQLSEEFVIQAAWIWNEGARIDIEYQINDAHGLLVCSGYTVQTFVELSTRRPLWLSPPLLDECRERWRNGDFHARS